MTYHRPKDPYAKQRKSEYTQYNRSFIRIAPLIVCAYIAIYKELFKPDYVEPNWWLSLGEVSILVVFFLIMEIIYHSSRIVSYKGSFAILGIWLFCFYFWLFTEDGTVLNTFLPAIALVLIATKLANYTKRKFG